MILCYGMMLALWHICLSYIILAYLCKLWHSLDRGGGSYWVGGGGDWRTKPKLKKHNLWPCLCVTQISWLHLGFCEESLTQLPFPFHRAATEPNPVTGEPNPALETRAVTKWNTSSSKGSCQCEPLISLQLELFSIHGL